jgi:hypothetical protein
MKKKNNQGIAKEKSSLTFALPFDERGYRRW